MSMRNIGDVRTRDLQVGDWIPGVGTIRRLPERDQIIRQASSGIFTVPAVIANDRLRHEPGEDRDRIDSLIVDHLFTGVERPSRSEIVLADSDGEKVTLSGPDEDGDIRIEFGTGGAGEFYFVDGHELLEAVQELMS